MFMSVSMHSICLKSEVYLTQKVLGDAHKLWPYHIILDEKYGVWFMLTHVFYNQMSKLIGFMSYHRDAAMYLLPLRKINRPKPNPQTQAI